MATFGWICTSCELSWEKDFPVGKAPKKCKCPNCSSFCERNWADANISLSFKDNLDFTTVRSRYKKHHEKGFDKDSANRFLNKSIECTKSAIADERARYTPIGIDYAKLAKDGKARKLSDKEINKKVNNAKKLTEQAYENANKRGYKNVNSTTLDISKPLKQ